MFRKSHLLIKGKSSFDASKQFVKTDFLFFTWGVIVKVRWSKTLQFRECETLIPLPRVTGSAFCPVTAIIQAFSFSKHVPSDCQAFGGYTLSAFSGSPLPIICFYLSSVRYSMLEVWMPPCMALTHLGEVGLLLHSSLASLLN